MINNNVDQLSVLPAFRVKSSNVFFNTLQEASKSIDKLTLNDKYNLKYKNLSKEDHKKYNKLSLGLKKTYSIGRHSVFKEIEAVSPKVTKKIANLLISDIKFSEIGAELLANKLAEGLMNFLESNWDGSKIHVIPHSSGYDSRMISMVLKKLYDRHGKDWLGTVYFVCWEPEVEYFEDIMRYEGWPEDSIVSIRSKVPEDLYKESLKFENVGKYCGDINRFRCYCFDFLIHKMINNFGLDKNNIRIVSGLFSDEALRRKGIVVSPYVWSSLPYFMTRYFHDVHFEWSGYDVLLPFLSFDILNILMSYSLKKLIHSDDIKKLILNNFDKNIYSLPNYRTQNTDYRNKPSIYNSNPYYRLKTATIKEMNYSFKKSNYSKTKAVTIIGSKFNNVLDNGDDSLKHYARAAICNHLENEGVIVNYE